MKRGKLKQFWQTIAKSFGGSPVARIMIPEEFERHRNGVLEGREHEARQIAFAEMKRRNQA